MWFLVYKIVLDESQKQFVSHNGSANEISFILGRFLEPKSRGHPSCRVVKHLELVQ